VTDAEVSEARCGPLSDQPASWPPPRAQHADPDARIIAPRDGKPRLSSHEQAAQAPASDLRAEATKDLPGGSARRIPGLQ
jgi:hypothetical protein